MFIYSITQHQVALRLCALTVAATFTPLAFLVFSYHAGVARFTDSNSDSDSDLDARYLNSPSDIANTCIHQAVAAGSERVAVGTSVRRFWLYGMCAADTDRSTVM